MIPGKMQPVRLIGAALPVHKASARRDRTIVQSCWRFFPQGQGPALPSKRAARCAWRVIEAHFSGVDGYPREADGFRVVPMHARRVRSAFGPVAGVKGKEITNA